MLFLLESLGSYFVYHNALDIEIVFVSKLAKSKDTTYPCTSEF